MKTPYDGTDWRAPVLCMLLLIGWKVDAVGFVGADMAHHYALVERLAEKWRLPPADDLVALAGDWRSLGEMVRYPALSHRIAAVVGRMLDSSFLGMQAVASAAAAVIWASIGAALFVAPPAAAAVAAVVAAAGLAAATLIFGLPAHGGETVGAYFFAQLVGQAFAFVCVLAWATEERRGEGRTVRRTLTVVAPFVAASFHLLPALELLAFFGCAALFDAWTAAPGRRLRVFAVDAGLTAAGAALTAVNPAVGAMLTIAANNGDLPLPLPPGNGIFAVLALAVLGSSAVCLELWRRATARGAGRASAGFKASALFAAGAALLCLAQIAALKAGIGNDYAVRKYIYSLLTGLIVTSGAAAGSLVALRHGDLRAATDEGDGGAKRRALGVSAFLIVAFVLTSPPLVWEGEMTLAARIVGYERRIKALRDTRLPPTSEGRYDAVAGLTGVPPAVSYMFALGLTKTTRDANAAAIMQGRELPEPKKIGSLVTGVGAEPYDAHACRTFVSAGGLAVVDGNCYAGDRHQRRTCQGEFDFRLGRSVGDFDRLLSGFSPPEPEGRWSDGDAASFRCLQPPGGRPAARVTMEAGAFLHPTSGPARQRATVRLNGRVVAEHVFTGTAGQKIFDLPLSAADGPEIEIVVETPDAAVPAELGVSDDRRRLGVQVRRIVFSPAAANR